MPVTTHKITHITCLATSSGGKEAIMSARCTCDEYESGPYSEVLDWWSDHIARVYGGKSASGLLDHIIHVAFAGAAR